MKKYIYIIIVILSCKICWSQTKDKPIRKHLIGASRTILSGDFEDTETIVKSVYPEVVYKKHTVLRLQYAYRLSKNFLVGLSYNKKNTVIQNYGRYETPLNTNNSVQTLTDYHIFSILGAYDFLRIRKKIILRASALIGLSYKNQISYIYNDTLEDRDVGFYHSTNGERSRIHLYLDALYPVGDSYEVGLSYGGDFFSSQSHGLYISVNFKL